MFIFGEMWYEVDIDVDLYRLVKYNCRFEIQKNELKFVFIYDSR